MIPKIAPKMYEAVLRSFIKALMPLCLNKPTNKNTIILTTIKMIIPIASFVDRFGESLTNMKLTTFPNTSPAGPIKSFILCIKAKAISRPAKLLSVLLSSLKKPKYSPLNNEKMATINKT